MFSKSPAKVFGVGITDGSGDGLRGFICADKQMLCHPHPLENEMLMGCHTHVFAKLGVRMRGTQSCLQSKVQQPDGFGMMPLNIRQHTCQSRVDCPRDGLLPEVLQPESKLTQNQIPKNPGINSCVMKSKKRLLKETKNPTGIVPEKVARPFGQLQGPANQKPGGHAGIMRRDFGRLSPGRTGGQKWCPRRARSPPRGQRPSPR